MKWSEWRMAYGVWRCALPVAKGYDARLDVATAEGRTDD
jgi:hypothetical protein